MLAKNKNSNIGCRKKRTTAIIYLLFSSHNLRIIIQLPSRRKTLFSALEVTLRAALIITFDYTRGGDDYVHNAA